MSTARWRPSTAPLAASRSPPEPPRSPSPPPPAPRRRNRSPSPRTSTRSSAPTTATRPTRCPAAPGGSTVPGPVVPFGMVQFSPDTPDRLAVRLPLRRHPDPGVQPHPLQRRRLPEQRGHRPPADHRQHRHLARHRLDRLRGHPDQEPARWPRPATTGPCCRNYGNTQVELSATKRTAIMRLTYPASDHRQGARSTPAAAPPATAAARSASAAARSPARSPAAASAARPRRTRSSTGWSSTGPRPASAPGSAAR